MKAREFRHAALDALRGKWTVAVIAGFIASLCGATYSGGANLTYNFDLDSFEGFESLPEGIGHSINTNFLAAFLTAAGVFALVYGVIMFILGSVVGVGYSEFNLDLADGNKPRIASLLAHFGQIKTAICANLLIALYIFVGFIFFVIPGIIAMYKYSMVNYIIAENPGITAREALDRSKELMRGNKWRFFCLALSFIGWDLLSVITFGIASFWVNPYRQAAFALFYREISDESICLSW